jgi:hypothetical protein
MEILKNGIFAHLFGLDFIPTELRLPFCLKRATTSMKKSEFLRAMNGVCYHFMVQNHTSGEGICLWGYVLDFEKRVFILRIKKAASNKERDFKVIYL